MIQVSFAIVDALHCLFAADRQTDKQINRQTDRKEVLGVRLNTEVRLRGGKIVNGGTTRHKHLTEARLVNAGRGYHCGGRDGRQVDLQQGKSLRG